MALLLLWLFNGIVFASVQFGISVMLMSRNDDAGGRGKRITFAVSGVPARANAPVDVSSQQHKPK